MNDGQRLLANLAAINSALYLSAVFVAGIYFGNSLAWKLSIATMGICFLSYSLQMWYDGSMLVKIVVLVSIATGAMAGLSLIR